MDYEVLLKRAQNILPDKVKEVSRFEVMKVRGHIQGNRTIISNFYRIVDSLRREPEHLLKYILKELATPGELKKSGALIIGSKVSASRINEKIESYVKEFVLCPECNKPDTQLTKENKITFIKCAACGAKRVVKVKL